MPEESSRTANPLRFFSGCIAAVVGAVILGLLAIQLIQAINDRIHGAVINGVVLDQDGQPLSGVEVTFRCWNWRYYIPIPWTPMPVVEKNIKLVSDANGKFSGKGALPRVNFVSAVKAGYKQDGEETEWMWQPMAAGAAKPGTLHLVNKALMQRNQIQSFSFDSVPFSQDGTICFDLAEGKISDAAHADIIFRWQRLPATSQHGEYGKYIISGPRGGIWLWEQERLFAPKENYESAMVRFFDPSELSAYMKMRRAEFFVTSRDGRVYARVFAQLNTGNNSLSFRGRVNSSGNRFVDEKSESYAIGVYGSLSPDYLNQGVPWWVFRDPIKQQVVLAAPDVKAILTTNILSIRFPGYYAGCYQTPPDVLRSMVNSKLMESRHFANSIAKNLAAPVELLQELKVRAPSCAEDVDANLATPEDLRRFLTKE